MHAEAALFLFADRRAAWSKSVDTKFGMALKKELYNDRCIRKHTNISAQNFYILPNEYIIFSESINISVYAHESELYRNERILPH